MTKFDPPIATRETEELVDIANCSTDYWSLIAVEQAKKELIKRNISTDHQRELIEKWAKENKEFDLRADDEYAQYLKSNEFESYSKLRMLFILIAAPLILSGKFKVGLSLSELKENHFRIMFKQRIVLLMLGTSIWIGIFLVLADNFEKKHLKEIEQIDISDWKKEFGYK